MEETETGFTQGTLTRQSKKLRTRVTEFTVTVVPKSRVLRKSANYCNNPVGLGQKMFNSKTNSFVDFIAYNRLAISGNLSQAFIVFGKQVTWSVVMHRLS